MSLAAKENTNSNMLGEHVKENGLMARAGIKTRSTMNTNRTALGNIANRQILPKNVGKENVMKTRQMVKATATASLHSKVQEKENVVIVPVKQEKIPVAPSSPAPMDISASSQCEAFSKHFLPPNVADIDKEDHDNPQLVSEYVNEIYDYMRKLEDRFAIKANYLDGCELSGRMRAILIDWLVQVHLRFHLLQETLYLTVAIIDRFLQEQSVSRNKLQLVGVTAMLIASKYEEMYAPEIADFVYITDNAYTQQEIRRMECHMLKTLDFNLGRPLPLHFLRRNSKAGEVDANTHSLAKYLMELTITDYSMCHINPSLIAASALCLSLKLFNEGEWSDTLKFYSKYQEEDLVKVMQKMSSLVTTAGTGKLTAIKSKYSSSKFMKISSIPELQSSLVEEVAKGIAS